MGTGILKCNGDNVILGWQETTGAPRGHGYHNGQWSQCHDQNSLTHRNLQGWLVGVPSKEIDERSTKFLLGLYKWTHSS